MYVTVTLLILLKESPNSSLGKHSILLGTAVSRTLLIMSVSYSDLTDTLNFHKSYNSDGDACS